MLPYQIIQGGKASLVVRLVNGPTGDPYDLTGATAITSCFLNDDGSELMLALLSGISVLNASAGKLQINLTAAQTALLRPLKLGTLEIAITFPSSDPIKVQIYESYDVLQSVC